MKPTNLFQLELANVFANGRSMMMKLGYAYLLGFPFALIRMPVQARVIGIVMLILFTSFYGAATTIVTRKTDGQLTRLRQLPIRRSVLVADFLLSGAVVDIAQVAVVIAVLLLVNAVSVSGPLLLTVAAAFVLSVLLMNLLGMMLGAVSRNSQEVHLIGAFGVALIAFLSGLFPVPRRIEPLIDAVSRLSPLRALATAMETSMSGGAIPDSAMWSVSVSLVSLAVSVIVFALRWSRRSRRRGARPRGANPTAVPAGDPQHQTNS
jgi:ABC-type multidrug transport system permease subunit